MATNDSRPAVLLRDITAGELAMDSVDGTGYPAGHVIGRRGTAVTVLAIDADFVEVDGFSDDSYATGFVPLDALLLTRTT